MRRSNRATGVGERVSERCGKEEKWREKGEKCRRR